MEEPRPFHLHPPGLTFLAGLAVLLLGLYGFSLLLGRADLPVPYASGQDAERAGITAVDGTPVGQASDLEFFLWRKPVGGIVSLETAGPEGHRAFVTGRAASYYRDATLLVDLVIALLFWAFGLAALLAKRGDPLVRIFFWLCLAFGFSVAVQGDSYVLRPAALSILPALGYIVFTALGPALLVHFSLLFPGQPRSRRPLLVYILPVLLSLFYGGLLAYSYLKPSLPAWRLFSDTYFLLRIYMIAYFLAAVVRLARIGLRVKDDDAKAQAQWVFFGLAASLSPFLFLYELPKILFGAGVLSENATAFFFPIFPAALAIAVIRHRLFDVQVVINRSLVYSLLTAATAGLYLAVVQVLQKVFSGNRPFFSFLAVIAAAAAFHPAQRRIQDLVDRAFFRQRYDYRLTVLGFGRQAPLAITEEELLDILLSALRSLWRPERAGIAVQDSPKGPAPFSIRAVVGRGDAFDAASLSESPCAPGPIRARRSAVRILDGVSFDAEAALAVQGLELALPLALPGKGTCGWLVLGRKDSGERYSRDDLSLLRTLTGELMTNLDRLRLQEEVIYERAARENLDELNRLKTEFISTVSHELRTPMSSIQGMAELLRSGRLRDAAKREEFLSLMVSESGRLSRFLRNVLDFGRIEQGLTTYRREPLVVQEAVAEAVAAFGPLLEEQGAAVLVRAPGGPLVITGDADALKQALMNLIDNAIKYSPADKNVAVDILEREMEVEICVADHGIGISPEDQARIFDRFYRAPEAGSVNPRGAGLGLKIVKAIVEAQGGTILLESGPGRGSVFRLVFPKREKA